ncbi:Centromere protein J [Geodia barretti]|uniref:Centromere protein J n=1 Tax=Geodia barretti TaxID=519541 RepID=A0AA35S4B9_GEOBA|nr:Centromere protein J [Geodia barretti]
MLERKLRLHSEQQSETSPGRSLHNKPRLFLRRREGLTRYGRGQSSPMRPVKSVVKARKSSGKTRPVIPPSSVRPGPTDPGSRHPLGSRFSSDESFIIRGSQRVQQEEAELVEFEELEKAAFDTSCFSQCSLVTTLVGGERGRVSSEEKEEGEEEDLDKTLTPSQTKVGDDREQEAEGERGGKEGVKSLVELEQQKSLAAGLVFSDDEEWESFSHTPTLPREEEEGSCPPSPWTSPGRQQCASSSTPLPLSPPHPLTPPHHLNCLSPNTLRTKSTTAVKPHPLHLKPHPLAPLLQLVSSLALRQDKKQHKSQPVVGRPRPLKPHTPRYPREAEVKERLNQLETEIERFRSLNSRLEQQTREKEESLSHLRRELSEFQEQMKRETEQFENYKRQETKKLRRERRVFETYVQETRAGQERRDREEIEGLKSEVQRLEEEMREREERWRAALARQRTRAESLEAQNRELQSDLRMMERERLVWWQEQVWNY